MMKAAYILMHQSKPNAFELARRLVDAFHHADISVAAEPWLYALCADEGTSFFDGSSPEGCDAIISVGGDGTLLRANALALQLQLPVLGVNIGRVGFLTEIEMDELEESCQKLRNGEYTIEQRMMLEVQHTSGSALALNDVVISRGGYSRLIAIDAWVGEDPIGRFLADGLIVSTPTGSTGYSLSAGGPLICPELECMVLTPICAHSLQHRPVVTSASQTVRVLLHDAVEAMVSVDGMASFPLLHGDALTITRSEKVARFIRLQSKSFFSKVRIKLSEWSC